MSPESWAIVGVVVGAILGGGSQILAGALSGQRDRKRWVDDHRRTAYLAFLTAIEDLTGAMQGDSQNGKNEPHQMAKTGPALSEFFRTIHAVQFYGSPAVLAVVDRVEMLLMGDAFFSLQEDPFPGFVATLRKIHPEIENLAAMMRSDLGIVG